MRFHPRAAGQSLVETALLVPLLLVLLAAGYWSYRHLSISSSAESAAHAHLLRSGRRQPEIEIPLCRTIEPDTRSVRLRAGTAPLMARIPLFGGLPGRTTASAEISCSAEPVGGFLDPPNHLLRIERDAAVDCWGTDSAAGGSIRGTVQGILLSGALR
jgi:hypothetical protein